MPLKKRTIERHKTNAVNESLALYALDEKGSGGAHHLYLVKGFNTLRHPVRFEYSSLPARELEVMFQHGPIQDATPNGVTNEVLLALVEDRLACFQEGPFPSEYNQEALDHVRAALAALHRRTQDRVLRGVEGERKP